MLRSTFIHVPGICSKIERRLWSESVLDWHDLLWAAPTDRMRWELRDATQQSERAVVSGDAAYFVSRMPPDQHWRLYPEFRGDAAFFDIETTGLDRHADQITTIVVYDGAKMLPVHTTLMDRIYVMRLQVFHGASTKGSSLNRRTITACCDLMMDLPPAMIEVMIQDGVEADWGNACFPPVK